MRRRAMCQIMLAAGVGSLLPARAKAETGGNIFTVLKTRRSVREYSGEPVSEADIKTMLVCAMQAPSAKNEQPWEFVVIKDRGQLEEIAKLNPNATFAKNAPLGILICLNQSKEVVRGMGILDIGMAAENLMLAARGLGLGSVFTGIFPSQEKMAIFSRICALPQEILPVGFIVIGHPKDADANHEANRYNQSAVHFDKW